MPALGRLFEVHAQRRISVSLLETYLGRSTGKRVLEGQIKHGDGQLIHAVIWFCDLRNSTNLAASMDTATYLAHLNRFLGAMAGAIIDHGGEILAYIGDAVLAIFPIAADGVVRPAPASRRPMLARVRSTPRAPSAQRIAVANCRAPRRAGASVWNRPSRRRRDVRQHRNSAAAAVHGDRIRRPTRRRASKA